MTLRCMYVCIYIYYICIYIYIYIYPAYVSKHNSNHEKQVIILMIPNGEGWYYLQVKKLLALLRGTTSKNHSDFYCLSCLHYFATEKKNRESHKKYTKIKIL